MITSPTYHSILHVNQWASQKLPQSPPIKKVAILIVATFSYLTLFYLGIFELLASLFVDSCTCLCSKKPFHATHNALLAEKLSAFLLYKTLRETMPDVQKRENQ